MKLFALNNIYTFFQRLLVCSLTEVVRHNDYYLDVRTKRAKTLKTRTRANMLIFVKKTKHVVARNSSTPLKIRIRPLKLRNANLFKYLT